MQAKLACSRLSVAEASWPVYLVHSSKCARAQASLSQGRHRVERGCAFSGVIKVQGKENYCLGNRLPVK